MKQLIAWVVVLWFGGMLVAQEATVTPEQTPELPEETLILPLVDPFDVRGDIVIAGSSTVHPLTARLSEAFADEGFIDVIVNDSVGTGAGFERFCVSGDTDISNASRAITEAEIEKCAQIGREPIGFLVGIDALAVTVSQKNTFLEGLSLEELKHVFSTAQTWQEVRPEFPNEPIYRFAAGTDSGTFDYFVEVVFDKDGKPLLETNNLQLSEDDRVLARGVADNPYAIGFFGFAYYVQNRDTLRSIAIEGVAPTEETAEDGTYPLARPLFIYSDATLMNEKPQVGAFISFYLTYVNDYVHEVGYFPPTVSTLNEAKRAYLEVME